VEPSITLYSGDYEHTEKLHMALQSGERTVDMSKLKYAGCTTSSRAEADVFSPQDIVKKEKIRISKIRNNKSFSSPQLSGHKRKKLSPDAFTSRSTSQAQANSSEN
jgi:transposase